MNTKTSKDFNNSTLWTPMRGSVTPTKIDNWIGSKTLTFHGFSEWNLPDKLTWQEDPFSNTTWRLWYHCLTWLYIPLSIYEKNNDTNSLNEVRNFSLNWMNSHDMRNKDCSCSMAWDDHAISYRSTLLVYLYHNYFKDDIEWHTAFKYSIQQHILALHQFLKAPAFIGHNHGFFHCFALLNATSVIPWYTSDSTYRSDAEMRVVELLDEMIDIKEGVTKEQAIEYQYIALELVSEVINFSKNSNFFQNDNYISNLHILIEKMLGFAFLIRWPDGSVPAIGDTWLYWNGWSKPISEILKRYTAAGFQPKYFLGHNYLNPFDTADNLPFKENFAAYIYPKNGYMMIKSEKLQTAIFMKAGPTIHSHGHHDHLSVQYFSSGQLLLLDSGGPYKYSDPNRTYFKHPRAHNTLVAKGQSTFDFNVNESDTCHIITNELNHLGATHKLSEKISHSRNTIHIPDSNLFICHDQLSIENSDLNQSFEKFWHLPPGSQVLSLISNNSSQSEYEITLRNGDIYRCQITCNRDLQAKITEGQLTPFSQGWVTTKIGNMEKAPVIEVDLKSNDENSLSCIFAIWPAAAINNSSSIDPFIQLNNNNIFVKTQNTTRHFCFNKHHLTCATSHKNLI